MSLTNLYTEWALKLHAKTAQSSAAAYVGGISDQALNNEISTMLEGGEESIYRTFGALASGRPGARVSAADIKSLLDACGLSYMTIDSDGSHPGVVMYFAKFAAGAARATGGVQFSATFANGLLVPRGIELPHQGAASMSAEIFAYKTDGTTPVAFNEADTLPAAVYPEQTKGFTLGPVKLNGTAWQGVDRVSIDPGIEVLVEARDSDIYPTLVAVRRIQPAITISGAHLEVTATLTEDGAYYTANQVVFYAKKRSEGGSFVADGTAEHIKFTLGKCRVEPISVGGNPKALTLRITPWYTSAGSPVSPLAVNTASAIT